MKPKVYADRMSQPSRAVLIFCKVNGIDFEEIKIDVPTIVHGRFKLFESHAILIYLAGAFAGVAHHWEVVPHQYPNDVFERAKINSVLDWHHPNLRFGATKFVCDTILGPAVGLPLNPQAAAEGEKILSSSLDKLESFWLKGNGQFLLGSNQPSIADLSLVCELMQLEVSSEEDRIRILGPHKKVRQWIEDTKIATRPHCDEVHNILFKVKGKLQQQPSVGASSETASSIIKPTSQSKM